MSESISRERFPLALGPTGTYNGDVTVQTRYDTTDYCMHVLTSFVYLLTTGPLMFGS